MFPVSIWGSAAHFALIGLSAGSTSLKRAADACGIVAIMLVLNVLRSSADGLTPNSVIRLDRVHARGSTEYFQDQLSLLTVQLPVAAL